MDDPFIVEAENGHIDVREVGTEALRQMVGIWQNALAYHSAQHTDALVRLFLVGADYQKILNELECRKRAGNHN